MRHAVLMGLASIAMLLPMGGMSAGRWAGLAAVVLCLTTGYVYGSLPFTPIDSHCLIGHPFTVKRYA